MAKTSTFHSLQVNSPGDIPEFLRETMKCCGNIIILEDERRTLICPLGSVIGYQQSSTCTSTGWIAWHIANGDTVHK